MDTLELLPRPRILLVDDDAEQLKICSEIIRMRGFSVLAANGAVEAISMMAQKPEGRIDLAVLDYNMPVMNGEEFIERLAEDEILRTIPVLVVSTDGSEHRVQRARTGSSTSCAVASSATVPMAAMAKD